MYVGVILVPQPIGLGRISIPHVRGGDPNPLSFKHSFYWYSPCTWGWSLTAEQRIKLVHVFPMYVGVILYFLRLTGMVDSIPHVRGGDPI